MVSFRRKKNNRQRANTTHGWGSMKKHRGAGNRGGRGNAGSGKKGDAKKPFHRVVRKFELGASGFGKIKTVVKAVNLFYIQDRMDTLLKSGVMTSKGDTFSIDLSDIKVDKLLGTGKVEHKLNITVKFASAKAIQKVEAAGGKVTVMDKKLTDLPKTEE